MGDWTRRKFIKGGVLAAAGTGVSLGERCSSGKSGPDGSDEAAPGQVVCLDGTWRFRTDPEGTGEAAGWQTAAFDASGREWADVTVPHTWQVAEATADYLGKAWYRREFEAPESWAGRTVRVEFEAVFHTAHIWVNGRKAGEHVGKGYTAFALDITPLVELGRKNVVAVGADNAFSDTMLPRNNSYDWAPDGGITRPARLIVTPRVYLENVWVDAWPDAGGTVASLAIRAAVVNTGDGEERIALGWRVVDMATGLTALESGSVFGAAIPGRTAREIDLPEAGLWDPKLWHFDHPHLYELEVRLTRRGSSGHTMSTTFGVRRIEVRGTEFLLNGEPVRLHGVERMAGSHPDYGMAEPEAWIVHDHDDLKNLNCVLTRVHWPQDKRVLDYCDRNGILIQLEVPSWGGDTFKGMSGHPSAEIMENGLGQLRELIRRDRNHPCVFSWGLCNEVDGQNPVAQEFVRAMLAEAKRLDPRRLCSYASNSLQRTPERDVAGEMDFIEWNEYYESWYGGTPEDMRRNLVAIHRAFPDKPIVISEYGYCACTAERPENDKRRAEVLTAHNRVFRDYSWVGGLIFFCYNDYRTHIGDKGKGVLKQRVHGVVDVFGARKPSYEALRKESGPIAELRLGNEALTHRGNAGVRTVVVLTKKDIPSHILRGYRLRWIVYGDGGIPLEQGEAPLPDLAPGGEVPVPVAIAGKEHGRVVIDVLRPTGFSCATLILGSDQVK